VQSRKREFFLVGKRKTPNKISDAAIAHGRGRGDEQFYLFFLGIFGQCLNECVCVKFQWSIHKKQNERFENEKTGVSDVMNKHFEMQTQHKLQHTETQNSAAPKSFSFKF
jgi:hypothetical protein